MLKKNFFELNLFFNCDLSFLLQAHQQTNSITKKQLHKYVKTVANIDFKTFCKKKCNRVDIIVIKNRYKLSIKF